MKIRTQYYQQFDADLNLDVPAEGYGGWKTADLELAPEHTAVVVMHAWDAGSPEHYPGWYRAVEYIPRANSIARSVFPPLLSAVRASKLKLFHVVGGGEYYKKCPGYLQAVSMAGPEPAKPPWLSIDDPVMAGLRQFKNANVFVGAHNAADVQRGFQHIDFHPDARPVGDEPVAENAHQLYAVCKHHGINHLIYAGFAINWCLHLSPGGMHDMSGRGVMCSALRQAVTAVENRETARAELNKASALWRVAVAFGFVYDVPDFLDALKRNP